MIRHSLLLFICCLMVSEASAVALKLKTEQGQLFVPQLKDWELGKDMFGMPFILFSPRQNGQRSNISFTPTGVKIETSLASMGRQMEGYRKMKKKWAKKVNAKPLAYMPYKRWKNSHGHEVHQVGLEYDHGGKSYVEVSYYVDCRGELVLSKSLRLKQNAPHDKNFKILIEGLDCGT